MAPYRPIYSRPIASPNEMPVTLPQLRARVLKQRCHHHPAADWENIKQTVARLYIEEKRSVEDVIKILKSDFNFNTGRRLFLTKLNEWGIQKNKRRREGSSCNAVISGMGRQIEPLSLTILSPAYQSPSMLLQQWSDSSFPTPNSMILDALPNNHHTPQWHHSIIDDIMPTHSTSMVIRTRSPSPIATEPHSHISPRNQESLGSSPQVLHGAITLTADSQTHLIPDPTSSTLEKIVSRLLESIARQTGVIYINNALPLKEDLGRFLDLSRAMEVSTENYTPYLAHSNLSEELGTVCQSMISARRIGVNTETFSPYELIPRGQIQWQQKMKQMRIGTNTIAIITKSGRYLECIQHNERAGSGQPLLSAKIRAKPDNAVWGFEIEMNEWELPGGSFSSIPRLSVHNVVPSGSLVFETASNGRVEDIKALFSSGQAGLHDHDERGWSLLHYSLENPEMCQFLARSGLDVDEPTSGGPVFQLVTPFHKSFLFYKNEEVMRILLAEGADPTISLPGTESAIHIFSSIDSTPLEPGLPSMASYNAD
ncbi:hypothetical protein O1611_g3916 [Lasiodiplodia mahajangana]|uniref:Uncharacterized protein n=1 Tax=Lasiodiplodia mahajangana TaxID=1108764 RepID=A0ACC2JQF2_9PEZI|nr:hypothetical protein O1611_g3916 [Lasiodiplodia mahajangana]